MRATDRYLLTFWILGATLLQAHAQGRNDFIVKDSALTQGSVVWLGKGKIQFKRSKNAIPDVYTANEINELGADGKVYESLTIAGEKKFARRLVSDSVKLFQYKRRFFTLVNDTLLEIKRSNFRNILGNIVTCPDEERVLTRLVYSRVSMSHFLKAYNKRGCQQKDFPYRKIGGYAGYSLLNYNAQFAGLPRMTDNVNAFTVGVLADVPFYTRFPLYFTAEVNWTNSNPFFFQESASKTGYFGLEINSLNTLLGIKHPLNRSPRHVYVKGGALLSYQMTQSSGVVAATVQGSTVEISRQELSSDNFFLFGIHTGLGLEIPFQQRKTFHAELRYLKTATSSFQDFNLGYSGCSILIGFSI